MKFTGEFFIPSESENGTLENAELEIEHRQRYLSILQLIEGKNVLDIASGEGYGSSLIAGRARSVTGVDINEDLVRHAAKKYKRDNLQYRTGSITAIPLDDHSVEVIVSFETLEHVSGEMQIEFLAEAKRVLVPGGILIISTPDKKNYTDRYSHHNSFHLHELYKEEFQDLLKGHFKYLSLYGQGMEVTSLILKEEDYTNGNAIQLLSVSGNYKFDPKYLIAICSDNPGAIQTPIASIIPENERSFFQMMDRILQLQKEVEDLGAWGTRSAAELDSATTALSTKIEELQNAHARIEDLGIVAESANRQNEILRRDLLTTTESVRLARESIEALKHKQQTDQMEIDRLISELAQAKHENFIKEAEIEVLTHHQNGKGPAISTDMEKFATEVAKLSETIANRKRTSSAKLPDSVHTSVQHKTSSAHQPDPRVDQLSKEVDRLEKDLTWYRKTYADRSLLGVLRQKLSDKFRK